MSGREDGPVEEWLLGKPDDLSSSPQDPCKRPGTAPVATAGGRKLGSLGLAGYQPYLALGSVRHPVSRNYIVKWGTHCLPLASICVDTDTSTSSHTVHTPLYVPKTFQNFTQK